MPEIRGVSLESVSLPEIRGIPAPRVLPEAPPVTLELGFPVVEMPQGVLPSFDPIQFSPAEYTPIPSPKPVVPKGKNVSTEDQATDSDGADDEEEESPFNLLPTLNPSQSKTTIYATEEKDDDLAKPFLDKALDGLPPVEAVVTTTTIALVAATAALVAKPFSDLILKLIKPTVKKVVKKVSQVRGKPVHVDSVWERRLAQRDRNRALRALRRALKP